MRGVQRSDQRLHDADGAIESASVAPSLQVVRLAHVPLAVLGGLIEVRAELHRGAHLPELRGEIEIVRSVVNGIAAEDQKSADLASLHVGAQLAQRFQVVYRTGLDKF